MTKPKTQVAWTPHRNPYEWCASNFRVSYMSNAKWYRVLEAIAAAELDVTRSVWKFIDSDYLYRYPVPASYQLLPSRLADGAFQPVEYKWIEWIRFPRERRLRPDVGYEVPQDIEGLKRVMEATAELQIFEDEQGLTIFGYAK